MKRNLLMILAAVALVTTAALQGRGDLASYMDGVVVEGSKTYNGTADTSATTNLDGRVGAALVAVASVADNAAGTLANVVLQDSTSIASWTARDSIAVDSVNNKYYDLHYRRTGSNVKLRTIIRGGVASAADSVHIAAVILRACQRAPC